MRRILMFIREDNARSIFCVKDPLVNLTTLSKTFWNKSLVIIDGKDIHTARGRPLPPARSGSTRVVRDASRHGLLAYHQSQKIDWLNDHKVNGMEPML